MKGMRELVQAMADEKKREEQRVVSLLELW